MSPMIERSPEMLARLEAAIDGICDEITQFVEDKWNETGAEPLDPDAISDLHVANYNWFASLLHFHDDWHEEPLISEADMLRAHELAGKAMAERREAMKQEATKQPEPAGDPELLP